MGKLPSSTWCTPDWDHKDTRIWPLPKVGPTHLAWRWSRHSERPSAPPARITASSKDALAICCTKASSKPRKGEAWNPLAWEKGVSWRKNWGWSKKICFLMGWHDLKCRVVLFFLGGRGSVVCKRPKSHWTIGQLDRCTRPQLLGQIGCWFHCFHLSHVRKWGIIIPSWNTAF